MGRFGSQRVSHSLDLANVRPEVVLLRLDFRQPAFDAAREPRPGALRRPPFFASRFRCSE
jgi:hypothetical protein